MSDRGRLYRMEGIILRRSDFGEADRLLTLFTPNAGKIRVIAKGARKPTSRKAGHVELFMRTDFLIARGRSLDIVTQAEVIEPYRLLREDIRRATYGHYLAELVDHFVGEGEENYPLYVLLRDALGWVCTTRDLTLTGRSFELRLLEHSGYRPELGHCIRCSGGIGEGDCLFSPEDGGVLCSRCGELVRAAIPISAEVLKTLRVLQGETYARCSHLQIKRPIREKVERVMREYITYLLECQLKSVEFLGVLRRCEHSI